MPGLTELEIRRALGIPADARAVLVFGESSHWDPNWLFTSEQYYRWRIEAILDAVIEELDHEPRRVFSIECLFFLQLYFERRPDRREAIRRLVNAGRLRLTGTGITTPDTNLPHAEAIVRDFLHGQTWLEDNGMNAAPRLAYFPDCFGHSPALPALLSELGYDQIGISRIDGMRFVGDDYLPASAYPRKGSSAELLQDLRTQAFVWRAPDGSEALCHWNAFTYFQGDMLAHIGVIRWMGLAIGWPIRSRGHIRRRIAEISGQLRPLARTPYLFCPIGCDFNGPIPRLIELLDRYNREDYGTTGIWAVNAGMDDYLDLVSHHRSRLPVLALDPNPYWMGHYASRPEVKRRCNRITNKLLIAEKISAVQSEIPHHRDRDLQAALKAAWDVVVVSNHHDFITGTSPDRVWEAEQMPWLERAEKQADRALDLASALSPPTEPRRSAPELPLHSWKRGRLEIRSSHYHVVMDEKAGGCLTSFRGADDVERLDGPSNDLIAYHDSGGLWRLGHEYLGGSFRQGERASTRPARIDVRQGDGALEVTVTSLFGGIPFERKLWFRADSAVVRMQIVGAAASRLTVACHFRCSEPAETLVMDVPGAVVERAAVKLHRPTFWAARSFVYARGPATERGLAAFLSGPACATIDARGAIEWVVLRNAPQERAFGFLPVLAHPASGTDHGRQAFDYAIWFAERRLAAHELRRVARSLLAPQMPPGAHDLARLAEEILRTDRDDVLVTAVKRAGRGPGVIARLESHAPPDCEVRLRCAIRPVRRAWRCDARERDIAELSVQAGEVVLPVPTSLTSVRLLF